MDCGLVNCSLGKNFPSVVPLNIPRLQVFVTCVVSVGSISALSENEQLVFFVVWSYPNTENACPIILAASSLSNPSFGLYSVSSSYLVNPFAYIQASACWNSVPVVVVDISVDQVFAVHVFTVHVFVIHVLTVPVVEDPVVIFEPVFMTIEIFFVTGSMTI